MITKFGTVTCSADESILITGFVWDGCIDFRNAKLDALFWAADKIRAAIEEEKRLDEICFNPGSESGSAG